MATNKVALKHREASTLIVTWLIIHCYISVFQIIYTWPYNYMKVKPWEKIIIVWLFLWASLIWSRCVSTDTIPAIIKTGGNEIYRKNMAIMIYRERNLTRSSLCAPTSASTKGPPSRLNRRRPLAGVLWPKLSPSWKTTRMAAYVRHGRRCVASSMTTVVWRLSLPNAMLAGTILFSGDVYLTELISRTIRTATRASRSPTSHIVKGPCRPDRLVGVAVSNYVVHGGQCHSTFGAITLITIDMGFQSRLTWSHRPMRQWADSQFAWLGQGLGIDKASQS